MSAIDQALQAPLLTLTERNGNDSTNRGHRGSGSDESTASTTSTAPSSLPSRRNKSNRSSSSKSSQSSKRDRHHTKRRGSRKKINTTQGSPKECFDPSLNLAFDHNNNKDCYDEMMHNCMQLPRVQGSNKIVSLLCNDAFGSVHTNIDYNE